MDNAITTKQVAEITTASPEDISRLSDAVIDATNLTNKANDELDHLSVCLADFADTQEKYQKKVKHVRNQMSFLTRRM